MSDEATQDGAGEEPLPPSDGPAAAPHHRSGPTGSFTAAAMARDILGADTRGPAAEAVRQGPPSPEPPPPPQPEPEMAAIDFGDAKGPLAEDLFPPKSDQGARRTNRWSRRRR